MEFKAWADALNKAVPGSRLAQARTVDGGNFTDVYELRGSTSRGSDIRVAARVFRAEARPGIVEKLSVVLPAVAASGLRAPELLWADPSGTLLGRPMVLLRWIDGTSFSEAPDVYGRVAALARSLAEIHETKACLRPEWAYPIVPSPELCEWARQSRAADPVLATVERLAVDVPAGSNLVHGDYWSGNVLWVQRRLAGVIDWDASGPGDCGVDVAKARLDLAIHVGLDAADNFASQYARERPLSPHQPFWNLREAVSGFPDPGRYWLPTYEVLGCAGLSPNALRARFEQYLRVCIQAVGEEVS